MGIFDNLSKFGIKNIDSSEVYAEKKAQKTVPEPTVSKPVELTEGDYVFAKNYECPVCDLNYQSLILKSNKARLIKSDKDLRPVYETIEPIKYEVISCPHCGYSVMSRYMAPLTPTQKKAVIENISSAFLGKEENSDETTVSYADALDGISLALACAMAKRAKASEKAYICLKGGWLCRSYRENLGSDTDNYDVLYEELNKQEEEFLKNAFDGLLQARASETPPIAGMDDITISFLLAALGLRFGQYDVASKMVATILQSSSAPSRIKDRARELKDELIIKIKEKK